MIYNTYFILFQMLHDKKIGVMLDLRPSITKVSNFEQATMQLIHPRLTCENMLGSFKNMHRVLDAVSTYYFENYLSSTERHIISKDLAFLSQLTKEYNRAQTKHLNFLQFFKNTEKF